MPTPTFPARFEHRRLLGEGGMGQVYLVHDLERDHEVALKLLLAAGDGSGDSRFLFRQEYAALAALRHPNLVPAYDYGELPATAGVPAAGETAPYFTMAFVPGHDLDDGVQTEDAVRAWLPGVAAALGFLHGRGYVHGDLKPQNIRLEPDGTAKIMDLGLLTRVGRSGGAIRGSLHYMAPEVIRQGAVDGRADLYALGALIYHLLAGRPPFPHAGTLAVLRAHLDATPTPLASLVPGVSDQMAAAVMGLLAKDPARRPPNVAALMAQLGFGAGDAAGVGLLGSPIIGREAELARLSALIAEPDGGVYGLVGPAGVGKTRLIEDTRASAQLAGLATISLQGLGTDAAPYQALRPLLTLLVGTPSELRDRLAPVLVKLAPELGVVPAAPLDGAAERTRLHAAIAEMALARLDQALWLIDEADQLDAASRELLDFLRRHGEGRPWRWLFAGATARAEADVIALGQLDADATLAVAQAILGQDALPSAVRDRLPTLSAGLPATIETVLAHWVHTSALTHDGTGWVAGATDLFDLPGGLQVALEARLAGLEGAARRLAEVAAVLGVTGELARVADVAGLPDAAFFAAFGELEAAELLAREDGDHGYRFLRPVQAIALAAGVPADTQQGWHDAAADGLASLLPGGPADVAAPLARVLGVAGHRLAGRTPAAAAPWVIQGAGRAIALFALDAAEPLLVGALKADGLAASERLALQVLLASLRRHQGRADDALAIFAEADVLGQLERAGAPEFPREATTYGVLLLAKGRLVEAAAALDRAIAVAEAAGDVAQGARARRFAGRTAYFAGRPEDARRHLAAAVAVAREAHLNGPLASALGLLGYLAATVAGARPDEGLAMLEEAVALHRAQANAVELIDTLNNQASLFISLGRFAEARALCEEAMSRGDRLGISDPAVTARLNLAVVALETGDLPAARSNARTVSALGQRQGNAVYQAYALSSGGLAAIQQGDLAIGAAEMDQALVLARDTGSRAIELAVRVARTEAMLVLGQGLLAADELALARQLARETQSDEHDAKLQRFEAVAALHAAIAGPDPDFPLPASLLAAAPRGASSAATQALEDGFRRLEAAARARGGYLLAAALRWTAALRLASGDPVAAAALATEARGIAADHGLELEAAACDALTGWARQAAGLPGGREPIEAALAAARAVGAIPLALWAEAALAEITHDLRARQAAAQAMRALAEPLDAGARAAYLSWPGHRLAAEAGSVTLPPAERLQEVLDLVAALDPFAGLANVANAALASLIQFTGTERGFLLLYDGAEVSFRAYRGMHAGEDAAEGFSSTLAERVFWSGQPLFIEDVLADAALAEQKSIQALALRTVIGLPLRSRGEMMGVLMADSRHLEPGFRAVDLELGMGFADQLAKTIEIARELDRADAANAEADLLHRLALATLGAPNLEAFLAPVALEALALTGAERCYVLAGDALEIRAAFDGQGQALPADEQAVGTSICRWVLAHGESLYLADALEHEGFQQQKSVLALALRMVHAVPVAFEGKVLGVLYLHAQRIGLADGRATATLERIGEMVGAYMHRAGLA